MRKFSLLVCVVVGLVFAGESFAQNEKGNKQDRGALSRKSQSKQFQQSAKHKGVQGRVRSGTSGVQPGSRRVGMQGSASGQSMAAALKKMDINRDGKVSKKEASERLRNRWDRIDINQDGFCDQKEIKSLLQRVAERKGKGIQGKGGQ